MIKKNYSIKQAQRDLPARKKTDNKTRGGKCLVIAGGDGQWGAAILCASAAARSGAGYTYVYNFAGSFPTLHFPDFLVSSNLTDFSAYDCIALGPGIKDLDFLRKCILNLSLIKHPHVILDAQALNLLSKEEKRFQLPTTWILTPHEGEMARLLKVSSQRIRKNREKAVLTLQKKWGCIVLLKGFPTLVADSKSFTEIKSGNSSLAKAGTGDVLTGIISGFLSQKLTARKAACLGAFIHGFVADEWIRKKNDQLSLIASDLITQLPKTINRVRQI